MSSFTNYYEKLLRQLSLDYNCTAEELQAGKNIITVSVLRAGRRDYSPEAPLLQMATLGANTVIMAKKCLHSFLYDWLRDVKGDGHHLMELEPLVRLEDELKTYGCRLAPTHHMFLPCRDVRAEGGFEVKWLSEEEIGAFYGDPRFPNAIAYPEPCPARPDRFAVLAVDGDTIMGMAGCSEDAPHWQQIGIDVLPEYRSRGIGSYLVTLLKNKIIEQGDVPFYGTATANLPSQNIAINSGFRPAWVETESIPDH